jgi:hypothetical protein
MRGGRNFECVADKQAAKQHKAGLTATFVTGGFRKMMGQRMEVRRI